MTTGAIRSHRLRAQPLFGKQAGTAKPPVSDFSNAGATIRKL
jgi:hypothetical protein